MNSEEELKRKTKEVEAIYKEALARLSSLKDEESQIIQSHINTLKEKRLAELKEVIQKTQ